MMGLSSPAVDQHWCVMILSLLWHQCFDDDSVCNSEIKRCGFFAIQRNFDGCERHKRISLRSWQRAAALHRDFKVASPQSDGGDSCQLGAPRFSKVMDEPATLPHLAAVIEASVVVAPQGLCFPGGRSKEWHPAPGSLGIHTHSGRRLININ